MPRWQSDEDTMATVLAKPQAWKPFDGGALLDDVAVVLDDLIPAEEQVEELAQRLWRPLEGRPEEAGEVAEAVIGAIGQNPGRRSLKF
jgi:hypothetical protein